MKAENGNPSKTRFYYSQADLNPMNRINDDSRSSHSD